MPKSKRVFTNIGQYRLGISSQTRNLTRLVFKCSKRMCIYSCSTKIL